MKIKIFLIFLCSSLLMLTCTPDRSEYPEYGDWFDAGMVQEIIMQDGDADKGTYEFYEFIVASLIDKGVCFDRPLGPIMNVPPPGLGMEGKWTVFVLNNSNVKSMASAYFGNSSIRSGANNATKKYKCFKLIQYYFVVGEYTSDNFPAKLTMDNGVEITVSGNTLIGADGNTVNFLSKDNVVRNGVFHVIDGPLHPIDPANYVYKDVSYFYTYGNPQDKEGYNPYQ